jgi:opacity protein-like surface antigen
MEREMITRQLNLIAGLTLIVGASGVACAADSTSPWSLSILGGDSVGQTGRLLAPSTQSLTDLSALDPALSGTPGTLSLDKLSYEDIFKRRYDAGAELDYALNENLQTYGRFNYEGLGGRTRRIGELTTASSTTAVPLEARFADADNMSFELGSRYYWSTGANWRPFVGAALGATRMDAMRASVATPEGVDLHNVHFTRDGTVFSQSAETGIEYNPGNNFGVRFSVDADHLGTPPSAHDPQLAELGINPSHDAESRWSFPVSLAATYRFD